MRKMKRHCYVIHTPFGVDQAAWVDQIELLKLTHPSLLPSPSSLLSLVQCW